MYVIHEMKILFVLIPAAIILSAGIYWYLGLPDEPDKTEIELYLHARLAYERGDLAGAISLLKHVGAGNSRFFQARLLLAKAYFFTGQYREAEKQLCTILKKQPACMDAQIWLLRIMILEENMEEAEEYGETLLSYSQQDPRVLGLLARIAYSAGDIQKSLEYYNRAILFEEELAINRIEVAKIYVQLFNPQKAAVHLRRAAGLLSAESPLRSAVNQLLKQCNEISSTEE